MGVFRSFVYPRREKRAHFRYEEELKTRAWQEEQDRKLCDVVCWIVLSILAAVVIVGFIVASAALLGFGGGAGDVKRYSPSKEVGLLISG